MSYSKVLKQNVADQNPSSTHEQIANLGQSIEGLKAENQLLKEKIRGLEESVFSIEIERQIDPPVPRSQCGERFMSFSARIEQELVEIMNMVERIDRRVLDVRLERSKRMDCIVRCLENLAQGNVCQAEWMIRSLKARVLEAIKESE